MKTIVVVDPFSTGHHPLYIEKIVSSFLFLGYRVLALCPKDIDLFRKLKNHPHLENLQSTDFVDHWRDLDPPSPSAKHSIVLRRWLKLLSTLLKHRVNPLNSNLFLPWLEVYVDCRYSRLVATLMPYKWSGILFQPKVINLASPRQSERRILNILRSRKCMKLSTLCFDRVNYLRGITGKQVLYFPDFIDEGIDSQVIENSKFEQWGSTETEKLTILLIGSLAKRKGLLTLLRCALLLKEDERIQFQIAGSLQEPNFAPEEKTFFDYCVSNSESLNIRFHLGRIETESEMNYLISRADILYGLYEDFNFSSNMLGKSAFFDTPLLASKDLYIGRVTEEFDLGWAIDSRDPEALREFLLSKLRLKLQNNQIRLSYGDQKKKSMFVMSNSADALTETLSKIFE